jgi:hypothetical protein
MITFYNNRNPQHKESRVNKEMFRFRHYYERSSIDGIISSEYY